MKKLLLFAVLSCACSAIDGMEQDRFKNVTRTRGSERKKETPSKKEMKNVTTRRGKFKGATHSFKHSPKKSTHTEPIFQAIAFDNAINRGDVKGAYAATEKLYGYNPAFIWLQASCKPQEKVDTYIGKFKLPTQINEGQFVKTAQEQRKHREAKLLGEYKQ